LTLERDLHAGVLSEGRVANTLMLLSMCASIGKRSLAIAASPKKHRIYVAPIIFPAVRPLRM